MYNIFKQWEWKKCTELRPDRPAAALNGAVEQGTIETETSCVSVKYVRPQKNNSNKMPCVLTFVREKNVLTSNLAGKISNDIGIIFHFYIATRHIVHYYIVCVYLHVVRLAKEKKNFTYKIIINKPT